jgi:hypothetical protein
VSDCLGNAARLLQAAERNTSGTRDQISRHQLALADSWLHFAELERGQGGHPVVGDPADAYRRWELTQGRDDPNRYEIFRAGWRAALAAGNPPPAGEEG